MLRVDEIYKTARANNCSVVKALHDEMGDGAGNTVQALRERRESYTSMMRQMLSAVESENRKFSAQEEADWRELERNVEHLNSEIRLEQVQLDQQAEEYWGNKKGPAPSGWRDAKTGRAVNVYAPQDRLSGSSESDYSTGVTTGDAIVSMVTGRGSEQVRASLSEGTDSSGGYLVPEPLSRDLIDRMRAKTRVIQAGARTIEMETETLSIAGIADDPTPAWRLENNLIQESNPTFNRLTFQARWLGVLIKTSRELMEDSPNAGDAVNRALAGALAAEWDRAALFGSGDAPEPLGLVNTTGVHEVSMGTDGAALEGYAQMLEAVSLTTSDNAEPPSAMIMAPRTLYQGISGLTDTTGQPLEAPRVLRDVPMLDTSGVPIDEEQGQATNASRIVIGDFSHLLLGVRSSVRIEILREVFGQNHQLGIVAWIRADVQVAHPKAFAQVKGIIPA
ncbi:MULTISPECIES: phage major capsid protein [unclassified Thioalkalivibrio]|uniref:phage major capsid protein n=1 Tax=unclassified Thioalkalivibrio TaxID=2621013 RepID=UPI001E2B3E3B|nr:MULTISPECIES: phage major capsid protein [unclassified Thioalkalivibrio]